MGGAISINKLRKKNKSKHTRTIQRYEKKTDDVKEPLKYYLANFMKDTDIMVLLHFLGRYLFQSIHNAPVEEILTNENCKVLDVGCGAGTWLLESATLYRSSSFLGIDLCTVYPAEIKPDNVEFMQVDVLNGLPFEDNTYDYVHQGNMVEVYTIEQWNFIISELIRVCKPGGYIEFTEPELAPKTGPILKRFYDALIELSESRNVRIRMYRNLIKILNSTQTVHNIESKVAIVPLGMKKGGNVGQTYLEVHDGFFLNDPMPETMSKIMNLSRQEYFDLFDEAKQEIEKGVAPDCEIYRIWCQKKI
ncbi:5452_t:CDS:2 [Funneliformis caledonium]|uniref:5452_t:CDS:1 n=1 Tax=Funneliformis caledonium TaxID=1117310 RepID=A0A9N8VFC9_9GLOM|nr:5452_t:CDS:2 [Funneliformis caledonium]